MNASDIIEELYDMYSDKGTSPRIVEVALGGLDLELDLENRPADLYLKL